MGEHAPPADTSTVETVTADVDATYDDDELEVVVDLVVDPLLDVDLAAAVD